MRKSHITQDNIEQRKFKVEEESKKQDLEKETVEELIVDKSNLPLEKINLSSLDNTNWLTSDVINEYGNLLKTELKSTHVFSTHFLTSLKNRGVEDMRGWTKNVNIFDKEFLFFPIHENSHWYLKVIKNKDKTVEVLDPYIPLSYVHKSRASE